MALIPICFIFSFYLGYTEKDPIPEIDGFIEKYKPTKWLVIVGAVIYMTALSFGIYYFTKWYLKKLYGKYVDELKTYIAELKDSE